MHSWEFILQGFRAMDVGRTSPSHGDTPCCISCCVCAWQSLWGKSIEFSVFASMEILTNLWPPDWQKVHEALHQTLRQLQGAKRRFSSSPEALGIVIFLLKINAGGRGSTLNIGSALFWAFHYSSHLALRRAAALTFPYVMTTKSHGSCKAAIKRPLRRLQQHARWAAAN